MRPSDSLPLAALACAALPAPRAPRRRSTSSPPATRTWSTTSTTISAPGSRRSIPGVQGARRRHRPRRFRLAEDLPEAVGRRQKCRRRRPGTSTSPSCTSAARRRWSSEKLLDASTATRSTTGKLVSQRQGQERARRQRRAATCMPMFHSQIAYRLQPRRGEDAAEELSPS